MKKLISSLSLIILVSLLSACEIFAIPYEMHDRSAGHTADVFEEQGIKTNFIQVGKTTRAMIYESLGPAVDILPKQDHIDFYPVVGDVTDPNDASLTGWAGRYYYGSKEWRALPGDANLRRVLYRVAVIEYDSNDIVSSFEIADNSRGGWYSRDAEKYDSKVRFGCTSSNTCFYTNFKAIVDADDEAGIPIVLHERYGGDAPKVDSDLCNILIYMEDNTKREYRGNEFYIFSNVRFQKTYPSLLITPKVYVAYNIEPGQVDIHVKPLGRDINIELSQDPYSSYSPIENDFDKESWVTDLAFTCEAGNEYYVEAAYWIDTTWGFDETFNLSLVDSKNGKIDLKEAGPLNPQLVCKNEEFICEVSDRCGS